MRRRDLLALISIAAALRPAAAGAWAAEEKKKKSGGVSYVPIDTLTGTTTRGGGARGVLSVECGLDIPDQKLRDRAQISMPRLRSAYVQVVMTYAAGLPAGAEPNADFIAMSLQRQTDLVLGRPGARVLVGAIMAN
ncbi:hypothetical protein [Phenylobacterium sp.]|jgi:hypothetical protein|uniref:hypothetical protein n=1 Tax=Phenylobacterium sp. TaxID=1871053 RepID=UPI002F3EBC85